MKLEEVVAKALNAELQKINDDTGPANLESWDSFNFLLLISEIEKNFKVKLSVEEVTGIQKVGDIRKLLQTKGVL